MTLALTVRVNSTNVSKAVQTSKFAHDVVNMLAKAKMRAEMSFAREAKNASMRERGLVWAEFIGYMPGFGGMPAFPLFNIYGKHPSEGSSVSKETLTLLGIAVPTYPREA